MPVVYRRKHGPLCEKFLPTLSAKLPESQAAGIQPGVVSADPREKSENGVTAEGWRVLAAAGLRRDQRRELGLDISGPRSPQRTGQ